MATATAPRANSPTRQQVAAEKAAGCLTWMKAILDDGTIVFRTRTITSKQSDDAKARLKAAGYIWGGWKAPGKGTVRGWRKELRGRAAVARQPHKLEVEGSIPSRALQGWRKRSAERMPKA